MRFATRPKATITPQKRPKEPRGAKPATRRAPCEASDAVAQDGFVATPEAKPAPRMKAKENESERPVIVAKKTRRRGMVGG